MDAPRSCVICGKALPKRKYRYCSDACAKIAEKARGKEVRQGRARAGAYHWMTCPDCGETVWRHVKCVRCEDCQREANKAADREAKRRKASGHSRKIGEWYTCEVCGKMYALASGPQRYCPDCAPTKVAENIKAHSREWARITYGTEEGRTKKAKMRSRSAVPSVRACAKCGKAFETLKNEVYCSDSCRKEAMKAQYKAYNAKRQSRNAQSRNNKSKSFIKPLDK